MKTEKLKEKYIKYGLEKADVFKHQHYIIITRSGIEKIAAIENINIHYEVVKCETNFAAVKAIATKDTNLDGKIFHLFHELVLNYY